MAGYGVVAVKSRVERSDSQTIVNAGNIPPFSLTPWNEESGKYYYGFRIVNGKMAAAGTDGADVYFNLIGDKASTGKVSIYDAWHYLCSGICSNTFIDLIVETEKSLGEVLVVILGIDGGEIALDSTWFVSYTVSYELSTKVEIQFPCYHWIGKDTSISTTAKTTTLKDIKQNEILMREREIQLANMKKMYQWKTFPSVGLPSGIDDSVSHLPMDEQFSTVKDIDFTVDALKGVGGAIVEGVVDDMNSVEDYFSLNSLVAEDQLQYLQSSRAGRWTSDVEFGRQILNGVNPVIIRKCTQLPPKFPVTDDMVRPFLTRGLSLDQEIEAGHIYICDLEIMDGLPTRKNQFASAPICLLYVNSSKQLVPIAIQLRQGVRKEDKKEPNPIFLPSDRWYDWLLAKIYYQSAHGQVHELSTHYLSCHAIMEAYAMATARNLPTAHPINKLLLPHFRYTMAINTRARASLINNGGIIDMVFAIGGKGKIEFFKKASKIYSVDWTNIKKNAKTRGVDDAEQLPGYYYRDDGLKLFNAMEEYVKDVVGAFYASDEDVLADTELQNWVGDIYNNAFPSYFGGVQGHDFPEKISTKDQLIERCTVIMFTGSCQHAAVNFGQYQIYGFCPNAPFSLRLPPPTVKGMADHKVLMRSLPDKFTAEGSIGVTYLLAQFSTGEIYLGNYPDKRFLEPNILKYIEGTEKRLKGIELEIKERNKSMDVPYTYLLPTRVPNSITI